MSQQVVFTDTPTGGDILMSQGTHMRRSAQDGIVAAPSQLQGGTPLLADNNRVTGVATGGNSVTLPLSLPGMEIKITNAHLTNAINVFPNAGGTKLEQIDNLGANVAFSLGAQKSVTFACYASGQWHTEPLVP